ncbi:hypothetical protein SODALDRAFT_5848 [Sodiomyces alkalinus F11]|uniref:Uncharacterized protein n=1 Tax=Sodiomyces alkalinus (strain CBS 110278 / VKM F-3762 / F11) TaxID=1314773 RepID=A0A3N2Q5S1_SODAK|nr:hypothetical protein SODALDRAFT_5848 [Sodiomyces alkalinus F11]ROT42047.1 hypothetical protein SODALDRAFT_5848 [Sodiomyces alkalinus F11]
MNATVCGVVCEGSSFSLFLLFPRNKKKKNKIKRGGCTRMDNRQERIDGSRPQDRHFGYSTEYRASFVWYTDHVESTTLSKVQLYLTLCSTKPKCGNLIGWLWARTTAATLPRRQSSKTTQIQKLEKRVKTQRARKQR